jgi:hypothetical protein
MLSSRHTELFPKQNEENKTGCDLGALLIRTSSGGFTKASEIQSSKSHDVRVILYIGQEKWYAMVSAVSCVLDLLEKTLYYDAVQ